MQTQTLDAPVRSDADAIDAGDAPPGLSPRPYVPPLYARVLSAIVAVGPPVLLLFVIFRGTAAPVRWWNIALAVVFTVVIGHAVTIGFHRLFTHRSFVANRPLKISLAVLGTMSFQGSLIGWVADHRRHHRFPDRLGDPHSPWVDGSARPGGWRGFWHAHIGWCFKNEPTSRTEFAPDLLADPDLVLIDKLFIPCCVATVALPFALGYVFYGTLAGAVGALVWAGILRIGFSHNVTWSINSVCHRFGKQPFRSNDQSRNVAWLAPFSMGESWHNAHHAFPWSARHGLEPGQFDSSAVLIRLFERLGWATKVRLPDAERVQAKRVASSPV